MSPQWTIVVLTVIALLTIMGLYVFMTPHVCDAVLYHNEDGSFSAQPSGRWFPDMNAFQQWWSVEHKDCKLPILKDSKNIIVKEPSPEQTYATTPIDKVEDYEFSRVFGYEQNGRMVVPPQDFNRILNKRAFDWADRPLSSDERRDTYAGLKEGFTTTGELTSIGMDEVAREALAREAVARYGERRKEREDQCDREDKEEREIAALVAKAYSSDPEYEPVLTKVGMNHWEVNELRPIAPHMRKEDPEDNRIIDTSNDSVNIHYKYSQEENSSAIDPYFPNKSEYKKNKDDPYLGYVPGLERMFGPTFDNVKWY